MANPRSAYTIIDFINDLKKVNKKKLNINLMFGNIVLGGFIIYSIIYHQIGHVWQHCVGWFHNI